MNNNKIGKLIAKLRKEQGLTQQQLGDKLNVGFRAVSKWERGLTLPDIGIIKELSEILGISSDELLSGKLNEERISANKNQPKKNHKLTIILSILILAIISIITVIIIHNNKTYVYDMESLNDKFYVEGNLVFKGKENSLVINKIVIKDDELESMIIKNYEYDIKIKDKYLFRYGYIEKLELLEGPLTANDILKKTTIKYDNLDLKRYEILNNNLVIEIKFLKENNEIITNQIELSLTEK